MKGVTGRERVMVAAAVAVFVAFAYLYGLLMPLRARAAVAAREEEALRAKIAAGARMYDERAGVEQEIATLRSRTDELLFSDPDVPKAIVRQLDHLASKVRVAVTRVSPEEGDPVGELVRFRMQFEVESDFAHAVRLLYELEQPEQRLSVEKVDMGAIRGEGGKLRVTIDVAAFGPPPQDEDSDAEA